MRIAGEIVTVLASVATAVGVLLAWWQIKESREQAVTSFEDGLAREYREIAQRLPVFALLGDALSEEDIKTNLDDFYHYVDLSNEQVFPSSARSDSRICLGQLARRDPDQSGSASLR